ncbi:MAG: gamma-glutamyltransferase [Burkholderiales bacterium]|nr:gamma-glutamyltransferase [Burkholderiales bacterium]
MSVAAWGRTRHGRCAALRLLVGVLVLACARAEERPQPEAATGYAPTPVATGHRYMAVTAHPQATRAALSILARGGSAVDAAIGAQLVLNVVEPQSSGIGGGGFLLHYEHASGKVLVYDGRETAPAAARSDRFLRADGSPLPFREAVTGARAVGVPGLVAMLWQAHQAHGRLPWSELFQPAIALAEEGFTVSPRLHRLLALDAALPRQPAARALYYDAAGQALPVGSRVRNPALAEALRRIARDGPGAFYQGALAQRLVAALRERSAQPDVPTLEDLAGYRAQVRPALCRPYRGHRVCSAPPPAGGLSVLQLLGLLEQRPAADPRTVPAIHRFAEAGRLVYADRARYLADPDYVPVPVQGLLDAAYLAARARLIDDEASLGRAAPGTPPDVAPADLSPAAEGAERSATTHLTVVDAEGNAVALTSSIEDAFGSRILVEGFLLNNQLTDFAFLPAIDGLPVANRVEGGKRPLSAMSPTLVFDPQGRLMAVLGSPGGSRIINYVARAVSALIDGRLPPDEVVALPHVGSRNGPTELEVGRIPPTVAQALRERGHEVVFAEMTSGLALIVRTPEGWAGAADPRREGLAAGE